MDNQPDANDVAFNTFIGVLVSVCGNVSLFVTNSSIQSYRH